MRWYALFSQSGSEIVEISRQLDIYPDKLITNQTNISKINSKIKKDQLIFTPSPLNESVYNNILGDPDNKIITLNGWLRIIPPSICKRYTIYNGHPGLITKYPELKGKDPQAKAVNLKLPTSGSVIHEVTEGVDEGQILASKEVSIENLDTCAVINKLHNVSINLWVIFLKQKLNLTTTKLSNCIL